MIIIEALLDRVNMGRRTDMTSIVTAGNSGPGRARVTQPVQITPKFYFPIFANVAYKMDPELFPGSSSTVKGRKKCIIFQHYHVIWWSSHFYPSRFSFKNLGPESCRLLQKLG